MTLKGLLQPTSMSRCIVSGFKHVERAWRRLLVSHRGKYSVERLVALEEYTRTTSLVRVLFVCLLTPLPVLFVVIGMECVPLSDPKEGWRANYGILIWTAVIIIIGGCSMVDQMRFFVAQIVIRPWSVIALSTILSIVPMVAIIAFAEGWAFPTPFVGVLTSPINVVAFLIAGAYFFRSVLKDDYYRNRFKRYGAFINVLGMLIIIYPAYTFLFAQIARAGYEITALMILSVIRTAFRNAFANSAAHIEDAVPQLVIFTADYFNAVYLATNMQSVSSVLSVLVMFTIDWGQLLLSIRWLLRRLKALEGRADVHQHEDTSSYSNVLFEAIKLAAVSDGKMKNIRLWSSIPHKLSAPSIAQLESMKEQYNAESRMRSQSQWSFPRLIWTNRVAPSSLNALGTLANFLPAKVTQTTVFQSGHASTSESVAQLDQALRLAFTIEYTALSEYLEAVVPLMYTVYVCVLRQLPNAKYHTNLAGVSDAIFDRTVSNMLLYWLMEFVSFVLLLLLLRVHVRLNILYVVAFVLETQVTLVQGMLITWMVMTRQYEIEHFGALCCSIIHLHRSCADVFAFHLGADYTFQFSWLNSSPQP